MFHVIMVLWGVNITIIQSQHNEVKSKQNVKKWKIFDMHKIGKWIGTVGTIVKLFY